MSSVNSIVVLPIGSAIALLLYGLYTVTYYVFFHPLSKVPGPKHYAVSHIPYIWYNSRGKWPRRLKKLHDRYGPVVRFTPTDVSFATAEAWNVIYGHKKDGESFEKDRTFYRESMSGADNIISTNQIDHRRMRRVLAHAFSERALRGQEDIMKSYINKLISRLSEKIGDDDPVDIVRWYNFTTFDLIGDLAFGEPFGCLDSGGYHPWVGMIFDSIRATTFRELAARMPILNLIRGWIVPDRMRRRLIEHSQLSADTAHKRIQGRNTDREDFMSYILRKNDKDGMTEDEIAENANTMIIAGSETTATLLSGATFQLLTNPQTYKKLVHEVRTKFESDQSINLTNVNRLEYMLAVLTESLRMYPPVPVGLPRKVPDGGEYISGYWMPEKTKVSVSHWSAYRSERNWREPERFAPERWLKDPKYDRDVRDVLQPFSVGPRNCIGKNLAYAEMRLILARIIWNFDLEMMPESWDWDQQDVYKLWEKGELKVRLTAAKSPTQQSAEMKEISL